MKNAQATLDEFLALIRRRKLSFILPIVIVITVCTIASFLLPKRYASSTTILVRGDRVLNPLVSYTMAVALDADDRLRDFNEIVYSRPILGALMDSLHMQPLLQTESQREQLLSEVVKNIRTDRRGSESFTIEYYDIDPATAQRAASILAQLFIQTELSVQNSKNDFAVQFFTQKLDNLRDKFEESQDRLVGVLRQHANNLSEDDRMQYAHIDDYDSQIDLLQRKVASYERALAILKNALNAGSDKVELSSLYEVPLLDVPYASSLQGAFTKYDSLSQKYTQEYPSVRDARDAVVQLIGRTRSAIESDLASKQAQIWTIEKQRNEAIGSIQQATVAQSQNQDVRSNYDIYRHLYDDMKIKLEQAQTSRDLGAHGDRDFVVVDPPQLPTRPAKPNVPLIIGGGVFIGLVLGLLTTGLTELVDPTIRTPMDVEVFGKPILAYLPLTKANAH